MTQTELFNIIEHERTKAGYTLKGFAKAIGSNKTSYNLYRNGSTNMGVQAMLRAFNLLGISITKVEQ